MLIWSSGLSILNLLGKSPQYRHLSHVVRGTHHLRIIRGTKRLVKWKRNCGGSRWRRSPARTRWGRCTRHLEDGRRELRRSCPVRALGIKAAGMRAEIGNWLYRCGIELTTRHDLRGSGCSAHLLHVFVLLSCIAFADHRRRYSSKETWIWICLRRFWRPSERRVGSRTD